MSEGPTIGDWTQYGWIPDGASSFPAMVRLRNAAWMVYYEPGTVVQRERAENAKLREERDYYKALWEHATVTDCELRRVRAAWKEDREKNDKLRELVRDMWEGYNDPRCEECHLKDTPTCADCPICAREASVIDRMRELGVEVDA